MSEADEKRELGGLAQSIDALFSKGRSTPPSDDADDAAPSPADALEPVPEADSAPVPADPFESFDAADAAGASRDDVGGTVEDADGPAERVEDVETEAEFESSSEPLTLPDTAAEPAPTPPPLPESLLGAEAGTSEGTSDALTDEREEGREPSGTEADAAPGPEPDEKPEGDEPPPGSALLEATDAFLAGHPGARARVRELAAQLRERMALDPLADAVERLVDAAEGDEDDPALEMAAKVINPAVASRLVQRMAQEDDEERRAEYIVRAQRLGIVMANAFKGALTDAPDTRTRRACHEGLIAMGETSRPVIEAMVEDDNRFLVQNGVAILGEVGGEGAVELVTSALANTDFRVRREAVAALAKLGGEDSGQLVMASLEDPDPTVRAAAAEAAGRLGLERSLRPILALLEDDDLDEDVKEQVHVQALRGLGYLGDPGAVQAIEKRAVGSLFSKPPTEVRVAAYQALHEIGTPHARQVLDKARDDKDPVVRTAVRAIASS